MRKSITLAIILMTFFLITTQGAYADVKPSKASLGANILPNSSAKYSTDWHFTNYKAGLRGGSWDPKSGAGVGDSSNYFLPSPAGSSTAKLYQKIDLTNPDIQKMIKDGQLYYKSSFYFYGPHESGEDYGLGTISINNGSANWTVNTKDWWLKVKSNPRWYKYNFGGGVWNKIPANATSIYLTLAAQNKVGSNMDAYFDDIVFMLEDRTAPELTELTVLDWDVLDSEARSNVDIHFPKRKFEYIKESSQPLQIKLKFDEPVTVQDSPIARLKLNIVDSIGEPVYANLANWSSEEIGFEYTPKTGHRLVDVVEDDPIVVTEFEGTINDLRGNEWNKNLPRPDTTALFNGVGTTERPFKLDMSKPEAIIEPTVDPDTYNFRHTGITIRHNNNSIEDNSPEYIYKYAWYDGDTDTKLSADIFAKTITTIDTPNGNYNYKLKFWVYDMAWNEGNREMTFKQKDSTAPVITYDYTDTNRSEYKKSHTLNVQVTDGESGLQNNEVYYKWTPSLDTGTVDIEDCQKAGLGRYGDVLTPGGDGGEIGIPTPSGGSGIYYLHIIAIDKRNNRTHSVSEGFLLDNQGPMIFIEGDKKVTKEEPITVQLGAVDYGVGEIDGDSLYYQVVLADENPEDYPDNWIKFENEHSLEMNHGENAHLRIFVKAKDKLGNSSLYSEIFYFDYKGPEVTVFENYDRMTNYGSDCELQVLATDWATEMSDGVDYLSRYYQWSKSIIPNDDKWQFLHGDGNGNGNNGDGSIGFGDIGIVQAEPEMEGVYRLMIRISDHFGNTTTYVDTNAYLVDNVAPQISFSPDGSGGDFVDTASTTVTLTDRPELQIDDYNYSKYAWSQSKDIEPTDWVDFDSDNNTMSIDKDDFSESGDWYLWVKAEDDCGNKSMAISNPFRIGSAFPKGSVSFTKEYTNKRDNEIELAVDDLGVKMQLSSDRTTWTPWEYFKPVKQWTLESDAEGVHKVYVRYKNNLGNESEIVEAQITMDKTMPTGSVTYDISEKTNGNVTATFVPDDSSTVNVLNNGGSFDYTFVKNHEFEFILQDAAGNIGRVPAEVNNIDKTAPRATLNYSHPLTEWTNEPITCRIELDDGEAIITSQGGDTHVFFENGEFTFTYEDNLGNQGSVVAEVFNIDQTPPEGTLIYSSENPTSSPITVYLQINEPVTVTNNGGAIQKIFTMNGEFTFEFKDKAGNTGTATAVVNHIDDTLPSVNILYSASSWTKEAVAVTFSVYDSTQIIDPIKGNEYTHIFDDNGFSPVVISGFTEGTVIEAVYGTVTGAVFNIDRTPPRVAYVHYSTKNWTDEPVSVTILPLDDKSVSIDIINNDGSPTKEFTTNGEFTFEFKDEAGNIGTETVRVNNITSSIPEPTLEYSTTEPTAGPVEVDLNFNLDDYPLELLNAIEVLNNNGESTYSFVINEEFTFKYQYGTGMEKTITARVDTILSDVADAQIEYYYSGEEVLLSEEDMHRPTTKNIVARITSSDSGLKVLNNAGSKEYEFIQNGIFKFSYEDSNNFIGRRVAFAGNIYKTTPAGYIAYSTTAPTKGEVGVNIIFSEPVTILSELYGDLSRDGYYVVENEDGMALRIGFNTSTNGSFTITLEDKVGDISYIDGAVTNIDKEAPIGLIVYSTANITNQDVITYVTANEPIKILNNGGKNRYSFTENGEFTFEIEDLAGNAASIIAEVNNIDKVPPNVIVNYSNDRPTDQPVVATVTADEEIRVKNNNQLLKRTFTQSGSFTFEIEDLAGNEVRIKATVNNIDKEPPKILLNGPSTIIVARGDLYHELGAIAVDNLSGDLKEKVIIDGDVIESQVGNYILTYSVIDEVGNAASVKRNVKVISSGDLNLFINGKILEGEAVSTSTSQIQFKYLGQQGYTKVKWGMGWKEEGFFKTGGSLLGESSIIHATQNGWYTIYFQDQERNTRLVYIYFAGLSQ